VYPNYESLVSFAAVAAVTDRIGLLTGVLLPPHRQNGEAGRHGEPRRLALRYFALGADPEGATRETIGHYYASAGDHAEQVIAATAKGDDEIRERVRQFEQAGADELILFLASPDPEQVDLLAAATP
jgi:alkanesulfonate monooxygenase SsuD/methylene tetrahydromethanopterin reductase-like flavin-dependent oxidoreductase (luciferase family)